MNSTYLSAADTAKLVRQALKRNFPKTKFSVKSSTYSMGASINVKWTDGPTASLVSTVTDQFQGSNFDGMIDMKVSKSHWLLPDGTTVVASNPGTEGSAGVLPAERNWMPDPEAKLVHFQADYIFTERKTSPALVSRVLDRMRAKGYQVDLLELRVSDYDGAAHVGALRYDNDSQFVEGKVREAISRFMSVSG